MSRAKPGSHRHTHSLLLSKAKRRSLHRCSHSNRSKAINPPRKQLLNRPGSSKMHLLNRRLPSNHSRVSQVSRANSNSNNNRKISKLNSSNSN